MVKDITPSHFWILLRMGYNMQRIWDANYSEDGETIYLDYKEYVPYSNRDGEDLFDYIRYKIYIPTRKQQRYLMIRKPSDFDYEKYFSNNNLKIE